MLEFRELAPEVRHFVFLVEGIDRLAFTPGQFMSVTEELGGRKITRAYSIASPPDGSRFELCLNRVQEGVFSPHLFSLRAGDCVDVKGPYGAFVMRNPVQDSVLVATGTGIAPFRSMLHSRLPEDREHLFTLLFGVRHEANLLYGEEFNDLARAWPNFRFEPTLSRPGESWAGRRGRVQAHLAEVVGERRDLDVYICGLKEMVDDVRARLKDWGFERRRIIYEKYD